MSLTHIRSRLFFIYIQRVGDFVAENYEKAERDYIAGAKYKDIAAKYGVSINTVKSWKTRYGWSKSGKKVCTQKNKKYAHKRERVAPVQQGSGVNDENINGLTENQRLFCLYYVKYRNQVKAYQKAYQCSYDNACACAYKIWKKQEVQEEIKKLLKEVRDGIKIEIEDLIQQQIDIARADINDFMDLSRGFAVMRDDVDGTLIKEIKNSKYGISMKLYDKQKAIDWLAKNIQPEESGKSDGRKMLADIILESRPNRNIEDFEEGD